MELKFRNKAAFCFGAFGKDIAYMVVNSYILYYYNSVLGMSATFIGTIMMLARVFDAANDPFMGVVVAKTKTKFGKFRPWIFCGTLLNALIIYALFAVPNMGSAGQRTWLAVLYVLWGVTYTLMDIPFWSMIPAITKPGKDREQLSSLARSFSGIGDAVPTVLTMVVVPILAGVASIPSNERIPSTYKPGFMWWALLVAVVFLVSEIVFVLNVPEKTDVEMEATPIKDMFKALIRNDQAMAMVVTVVLVYTAFNIISNLILYFFQYDLGDTGAYSVFTAICFGTQVIIMLLVPTMRKKVEKLRLFSLGIIAQIIGFLVLLALSFTGFYHATGWIIFAIPGILVFAGYGILNVMLTVFLSDTVDYGEFLNGTREESVIFSMQTFTVKLASGVGVFLAGIAIDSIGLVVDDKIKTLLNLKADVDSKEYAKAVLENKDAIIAKFQGLTVDASGIVHQSASTLKGLMIWMTIPSTIVIILAFLVFKKHFKLTEEKMAEVTAKIGRKEEN